MHCRCLGRVYALSVFLVCRQLLSSGSVCVCVAVRYCKLRVLCLTGIVVCVWGFVCVAVALRGCVCVLYLIPSDSRVSSCDFGVCVRVSQPPNVQQQLWPPWPCACVCEFIILDSICGPRCHCKLPVCSAVTL